MNLPLPRLDPIEFTRGVLGLPLYDWQAFCLWDIGVKRKRTALKAANESGKTSRIAAPLALWFAHEYPGSTTVITSGSWLQVEAQAFPSMAKYSNTFPSWTFNHTTITTPGGSRIIGLSTNDAGFFEGFHAADHEEQPLLIIVDEAKSVEDSIFDAIERCRPTMLLVMSSPGGASGRFYKIFSDSKLARSFCLHTVTAFQCLHLDPKMIEEQIERNGGKDNPLVRSMIFAEFMEGNADHCVIARSHVERLLREPPQERDNGEIRVFCDFAAGGDENVIAVRRGNRVFIQAAWKDTDTMRAVGRFIIEFRKAGLKESDAKVIWGDNDGLGKVMIDALHEAGWMINRESNGAAASNPKAYFNRGAELWFNAAREIEKANVILPHDDILVAQLTSRKGYANSKGQMKLETKEEMAIRGLTSPDRADAVVGALFERNTQPISYTPEPDCTDYLTSNSTILSGCNPGDY